MAGNITSLKKWFLQWVGLLIAMFLWWALYVFASSLNATDGETLTASKWNALVDQVNNSSADIVCPSGFVSVWSGYQLWCIQSALNPAKLWIEAANDCINNYWARLPSPTERYFAAVKNSLSIINSNHERIDVTYYASNSWEYRFGTLYNNSWVYRWSGALETQPYSYRCFIPR